ncbi:MAG TPA: 2-hydroxyacyl-CoA dehydratase family protein [Candidatus Bathyarchaeia archaeon]|nr:2-hydroxyacyl-CoA dehydratase family protein [Candidatus Bathyarchaeia archaeon]
MEALQPFRRILSNRHEAARQWKSRGGGVVGWTCTYTPEEVIYASGALPVMVCGSLGETNLADAYMPSNSCSFARSCFNAALRGEFDYLDAFVESTSCDNREKTFDMWVNYSKVPNLYLINMPHTNTESAHQFYYQQVVKFKEWLEQVLKSQISEDSLKEAVAVYNENRNLLRQIYDLKMKKPPLLSGTEYLEIALSGLVMPKTEHNQLMKALLSEVESRADMPREGLRLMVSGSVMDNTELVRLIESVGGTVVADDWCTGSRYFWNDVEMGNGDPLKAIARRYLDKVPSSFMYMREQRFKHVAELAKRFDVDGVIMFLIKYCDTHMFDAPYLRDELKAMGLPVLYLEWEHSMSGFASLKTRIEAFVEMVGGVQ